jgi:3-hydroxyacyl-[acyl-carrier-protein] dehydratase
MDRTVFKIKQISAIENTFHYSAEIDNAHPVFKGHFPDTPVVPGVCTMLMLKQCIADAIACEVKYDYIKECKFLSVITPLHHKLLDVHITLKENEEGLHVVSEVIYEETKMLKLKAILK